MKWQLGILLLAILPLPLSGCRRGEATADAAANAPRVMDVNVVPVRRGHIKSELELVGTLIPIRATTIVSEVDGIIHSFPASERKLQIECVQDGVSQPVYLGLDIGHQVKQGEVLVQIDPTDLQLALRAAEAERDLAKRNLEKLLSWRRPEEDDRLKAALAEARAARDRAQADMERSEQAFAKNAISKSTCDAAVMAARTADAALQQADAVWRLYLAGPTKEEIAVGAAQVAAAQAQVAVRKEKFDKATIRAPYDAVVCNRYVDVGDRVTAMPRVEILQIMDPRVLFAEVSVPEKHQGRIKLDQRATVTAEGGLSASGRIDLINSMVDPQTRTFRVRVTIDNTQGTLKAGGFVHVGLPAETASNVLLVPVDAVTFNEGRPAVFVCRDGRVYKTPVKVGISDGTDCEVSGVSEGTCVVAGGTSLLADSLPVRPIRPARPPAAAQETPP